ncbi:MAG: hypothetical protein ACKO96_08735, partial [Flammeovirgaceae bacterium]
MNSENRKFEDEWKRAFADAESDVNDAVWVNIDSKLANAENGAMKKRVFFYQWLAAASVVFALLVGGAWLLVRSDKNQPALSQQVEKEQRIVADSVNESSKNEIANTQPKNDFPATRTSTPLELEKTNPSAINSQPATHLNKQTTVNRKIEEPSIAHVKTGVIRHKGSVAKSDHTKNNTDSQRSSSENITITTVVADISEKESKTNTVVNQAKESETPVASNALVVTPIENLLLATDTTTAFIESPVKVSSKEASTEPTANTQKRDVTTEEWWASLTGSAGSYTAIRGSGTSSNSPLNTASAGIGNTSNSSNEKVGTSFSYGINVGKQIAPRWVVIAGVGYMNQSININIVNPYNSAVLSYNQAQDFIAALSRSNVNATATAAISSYELTSVNEFVTIPLQAGYLLVNQKMGIQLNAGIASDLFLRNTLSDPTGKLPTNQEPAGDASTYKTVNWSG